MSNWLKIALAWHKRDAGGRRRLGTTWQAVATFADAPVFLHCLRWEKLLKNL